MSDKARQICRDVKRLVRYKADKPGNDIWQTPATTEKLRTGDCDDYAILTASRCKRAGVKCRLVIGYSAQGGHMVCAGDGWYASNGNYYQTNDMAASMRHELRWKSIKTFDVTSGMLRKKGVRL